MDVLVDPDGHLMGAFGVALLAAEAVAAAGASGGRAGRGGRRRGARRRGAFDFDAMERFAFTTREVECSKCANHCEIICVYRDGNDLIDSWGNRCEKGEVKTKR